MKFDTVLEIQKRIRKLSKEVFSMCIINESNGVSEIRIFVITIDDDWKIELLHTPFPVVFINEEIKYVIKDTSFDKIEKIIDERSLDEKLYKILTCYVITSKKTTFLQTWKNYMNFGITEIPEILLEYTFISKTRTNIWAILCKNEHHFPVPFKEHSALNTPVM